MFFHEPTTIQWYCFSPLSVEAEVGAKLPLDLTTCCYAQAEGREISPHVVRKALENTATPLSENLEGLLTTGRGLLQVDRFSRGDLSLAVLASFRELCINWSYLRLDQLCAPGPTNI